MRIRDLIEWPPADFEGEGGVRVNENGYRIQGATFIPASKVKTALGHIILRLEDKKTGEACTARVRMTGMSIGRRVAVALSKCKGLSLAQAGEHRIDEEKK